MSVLIKGATLLDCLTEHKGNILIKAARISEVTDLSPAADRVIDGRGLVLMPSFTDLHAHFRDPGLTHKEDIRTGSMAAVHGGFTHVNLMPNTKPVCSDIGTVEYVLNKAREAGLCDISQTVSITKDFDGKTLDHLKDINSSSIKWLTDDGFGVDSTAVIFKAMQLAKDKGIGLMLHEEDSALSKTSMYLAEDVMTLRDCELAESTGAATHFCHVSTEKSMRAIINAKKRCGNITCEVSPHHLALNDTHPGKVNPPLRRESDRLFLVDAIKNGYVDAIATDHAPHTAEEKANGANGFIGLEHAFAVCYTTLVRTGIISLGELVRMMSEKPAMLMGREASYIKAGSPASLVLIDLNKRFTVKEDDILSKSKNTPFLGHELYGEVKMTINRGKIVYEADRQAL